MTTGTVTADHEATVRLELVGPTGRNVEVEAVIDTGFSEYVTLPPDLAAALEIELVGSTKMELADGTITEMPAYRAVVLWDGVQRRVAAHGSPSEPLIGMSLLYGSRLTIDVVDGGAVSIEPLA